MMGLSLPRVRRTFLAANSSLLLMACMAISLPTVYDSMITTTCATEVQNTLVALAMPDTMTVPKFTEDPVSNKGARAQLATATLAQLTNTPRSTVCCRTSALSARRTLSYLVHTVAACSSVKD